LLYNSPQGEGVGVSLVSVHIPQQNPTLRIYKSTSRWDRGCEHVVVQQI
jgi:hypothetical protein